MNTLKEAFAWAQERGVALGHFNISDSNQLNGIVSAAKELAVPVVIGVSEGEREFLGIEEFVPMAKAAREEYGIPVFTNADHTYSVDGCKRAIDLGFDSVIFDGSKISVEENIKNTKEVVDYVKEKGLDTIVEGELGYIGTSSKLLEDVPDDVLSSALPTAEMAKEFIEKTGVYALAPAVGNIHGMLKGRSNPALNIPLIKEIKEATNAPLVLHGASGITDDDIRKAISAGINMVHVNTEIRVAYRKGIEEALEENPDEVAPYRYLDDGRDAVKEVVLEKLKLFNNI